jgi:hypothetical protein
MVRTCSIVTAGLWIVTASMAMPPQPIEWLTDPDLGYAEAKKAKLPILFYLDAPPSDEELSDEAQESALAHQLVARAASGRFIAIRLRHASITQTLMQQMQVTDAEPFSVVAATPDGTWVGTISPEQVAQPATLALELKKILNSFGGRLYTEELKPVLEDKSAKPANVRNALELIAKFAVTEADQAVIAMLNREGLDAALKPPAYRALAALSTKPSVEALVKAAVDDEAAAKALQTCTPAATELLLPLLNVDSPDTSAVAYDAVIRICAIGDAKPQEFWKDSTEEVRSAEIERVKQAATACMRDWERGNSADTR